MNIGTLIRKCRKDRKLTLKVVAEKASISEGFLSQVENDVNSPSVETLIRICNAIGVDAGELISRVNRCQEIVVIRKTEWDEVDFSHTGFVTRRFLGPEYRTIIDSAILVVEPGKSIPARKNIRNGQEVLCVLRGAIELILGERTYMLMEGDCVHLFSNREKEMITNTGSSTGFVLWVGTV
ncbi:MAG: helix-turn-helix domain-containing protein [Syntrophobacteraceae bacterium]